MDPNSAVAGSHVSCPKTHEEGLNPNFGPSVPWTKKKNSLVVLEERINELSVLLNLEVCARWLLEWL